MMLVENLFELKQTVYLKTDREQLPRLVTGIEINAQGLMYKLTQGREDSYHYDFEISTESDILLTSTN